MKYYHIKFKKGGNVILTDQNYQILALLRSYKIDENDAIQVGNFFTLPNTMQEEKEGNSNSNSQTVPVTYDPIYKKSLHAFKVWAHEKELEYLSWESKHKSEGSKNKSSSSKKKNFTLKQLLLCVDSGVTQFGSEFIEHCILSSGLPNARVTIVIYLVS
jgi:hypothetical protein